MRNSGATLHGKLESLIYTADAAHAFVVTTGTVIATMPTTADSLAAYFRVQHGNYEERAQELVAGILRLEAKLPQWESGDSIAKVDRLARVWHGWLTVTDALLTDAPGTMRRYLGPIQVMAALFDTSGQLDGQVTGLPDLLPTIQQVRRFCSRPNMLAEMKASVLREVSPSPEMDEVMNQVLRGVRSDTSQETVVFLDGLAALSAALQRAGEMPGADEPDVIL